MPDTLIPKNIFQSWILRDTNSNKSKKECTFLFTYQNIFMRNLRSLPINDQDDIHSHVKIAYY